MPNRNENLRKRKVRRRGRKSPKLTFNRSWWRLMWIILHVFFSPARPWFQSACVCLYVCVTWSVFVRLTYRNLANHCYCSKHDSVKKNTLKTTTNCIIIDDETLWNFKFYILSINKRISFVSLSYSSSTFSNIRFFHYFKSSNKVAFKFLIRLTSIAIISSITHQHPRSLLSSECFGKIMETRKVTMEQWTTNTNS